MVYLVSVVVLAVLLAFVGLGYLLSQFGSPDPTESEASDEINDKTSSGSS